MRDINWIPRVGKLSKYDRSKDGGKTWEPQWLSDKELFEILERHKGWRIKLAGAEEQKGKRKSFEKKKVFNIVFRDDQGDWLITLITTDERSPEEIESLIDYYDEVNSRNSEEYSPLDIMVDIVDANPGWYWCDFNFDIDRKR